MGLDTSFDCWHAPYSSFQAWRTAVAEAAGYRILRKVRGSSGCSFDLPDLDWDAYTPANFEGRWRDGMPSDPLLVLLVHSDCDGKIELAHCGPLADRLEELIDKMAPDVQTQTWRFIVGLRQAVEAKLPVEFH
jgi:hypothetical protein